MTIETLTNLRFCHVQQFQEFDCRCSRLYSRVWQPHLRGLHLGVRLCTRMDFSLFINQLKNRRELNRFLLGAALVGQVIRRLIPGLPRRAF